MQRAVLQGDVPLIVETAMGSGEPRYEVQG